MKVCSLFIFKFQSYFIQFLQNLIIRIFFLANQLPDNQNIKLSGVIGGSIVVHGGIKQQDMIKTGINGNFSPGGGEFSTFKTGIPGVPGREQLITS